MLKHELGVRLLDRRARGVTLTRAGKAFLDHARLALLQVETAVQAARNAERPQTTVFRVGFLAGQEVVWLPQALRILREEAPDTEIVLSSQSSPELARALASGHLDVAFLRPESNITGLAFRALAPEPLIAVLPARHRLAARKKISPQDIADKVYVSSAWTSPVLASTIARYAAQVGITLKAEFEGDNLPSAMSLVSSTGGLTLIPLYAQNMLTSDVVARALDGSPPDIELSLGYAASNTPALLRRLLARADELAEKVQGQSSIRYAEGKLSRG